MTSNLISSPRGRLCLLVMPRLMVLLIGAVSPVDLCPWHFYSSIDASDPLANYLACDAETDSLDIYGLNNYRWCGSSSFESSYASVEASFANFPVAAYFSEYGCVTSPPRLWTEASTPLSSLIPVLNLRFSLAALFSSQMTPVWSGGIAFSYFFAVGGYGMVEISSDNTTVTTSDDFTRLKNVLSTITTVNDPVQSSAGQSTYPSCPSAVRSIPLF